MGGVEARIKKRVERINTKISQIFIMHNNRRGPEHYIRFYADCVVLYPILVHEFVVVTLPL